MKGASLVKLSTPYSFAANLQGDKDQEDISEYLDVKKSTFDKKVQIMDWIKTMEEGSTIEEILNSIITIKTTHKEGTLSQ